MPSHSPSNHRCWYPDKQSGCLVVVFTVVEDWDPGRVAEARGEGGVEGEGVFLLEPGRGYLDRLTYMQQTLLLTSFVLCASAVRARVADGVERGRRAACGVERARDGRRARRRERRGLPRADRRAAEEHTMADPDM